MRTYIAHATTKQQKSSFSRIHILSAIFVCLFFIVICRLFILMIWQHSFYDALATGSHERYAELFPVRGNIFISSQISGETFPLALNRDVYLMYADTREIVDDETSMHIQDTLADMFHYDSETQEQLFQKLQKRTDPYEPIEQRIDEDQKFAIEALALPGIHFIRRPERFYPEHRLAAHVLGFVGKNEQGADIGHYGLEGYWQDDLAGSGGFLEGARSAKGSWIPLAGRSFSPAQDGVNLTLTLDRTLQHKTCAILEEYREAYEAQTASLVIMDPLTGAIQVMCSFPDFDPNTYNKVDSVSVYNNTAIFTPYEPGSIFKPIAVAAAINEGILKPSDVFHDTGSVSDVGCIKPIKNANLANYGDQTITGILENSINTGMVYVVKQLGKLLFRDYVERFGFGLKTGIELDTEIAGTIESLHKNNKDTVDCYTATASFGQGITATPLQMASAFSVLANGGKLMRPYVIASREFQNKKIEKTQPYVIREVVSKRTAQLVSAMLVRVIDEGQSSLGHVPGYYLAGKTGTAQIAGPGGYTADTNHSFAGFGPVDNPRFTVVIKFEKPKRAYASLTSAPVFAKIAQELIRYYNIAPDY